jgi:hypothetical protein
MAVVADTEVVLIVSHSAAPLIPATPADILNHDGKPPCPSFVCHCRAPLHRGAFVPLHSEDSALADRQDWAVSLKVIGTTDLEKSP